MDFMPVHLTEAEIRQGLLAHLHGTAVEGGLIRGELPVLNSRIDVVRISQERIEGFEIKSYFDKLSRLPEQAASYDQVFDDITLVTGSRLAGDAFCVAPHFWGMLQARITMDGRMVFVRHRHCAPNRRMSCGGLASMLWRDEAAECLRTLSTVNVRKSWSGTRLRKEIIDHVPKAELRLFVAKCLSNPQRFEAYKADQESRKA